LHKFSIIINVHIFRNKNLFSNQYFIKKKTNVTSVKKNINNKLRLYTLKS
jgi:hypothetical protein